MADSRAATITALDAYLAAEGINYDGNTDGFTTALNHGQLKELFRVADTQGAKLKLTTGGILLITPVLTDIGE